MLKKITLLSLGLLIAFGGLLKGQTNNTGRLGQSLNAITTGVPFLLIAPDARGGSMGDVGAATSPDAN